MKYPHTSSMPTFGHKLTTLQVTTCNVFALIFNSLDNIALFPGALEMYLVHTVCAHTESPWEPECYSVTLP